MGVPSGIIIAWPSTAASIPAGWSRKTALDDKYVRGAASAGDTGGDAAHAHAISGHGHNVATHAHAVSGSPSAANVAASIDAGTDLTTSLARSHPHPPGSSTASQNGSPLAASGSVQNSDNDLPHLKVIWIESDGSPGGIPNNAISLWSDDSGLPSGWDQPASGKGRHLKGATPGGDGGSTAGTLSHPHTANSHGHNDAGGHWHAHNLDLFIGTGRGGRSGYDHTVVDYIGLGYSGHRHPGETDAEYCDLPGQVVTVTAADKKEPLYRDVGIIQNSTGDDDLPVGLVAFWAGAAGAVPAGWHVCDGADDTPDWDDARFVRGSSTLGGIGATGGYATPTHSHTTSSHNHGGTAYHTHTRDGWYDIEPVGGAAAGVSYDVIATHHHNVGTVAIGYSSPAIASAAPSASAVNTTPSYYDVILVQYVGMEALLSTTHNLFGQRFRVFDDGAAGEVSFERRDLASGDWSAATQPFGEGSNSPDIECLADGRLRCAIIDSDGNKQQFYSSDDGETWSAI